MNKRPLNEIKFRILLVIALGVMAMILVLLPEIEILFNVGLVAGSSYVVFRLASYIRGGKPIELNSFFSFSILAAYVLSAMLVQANLWYSGHGSVADYFLIPQEYLSGALSLVFFSAAILSACSAISPIRLDSYAIFHSDIRPFLGFVVGGTIFVSFAYFLGILRPQGQISLENSARISAIGSLAALVVPALLMIGYCMLTRKDLVPYEKFALMLSFFLAMLICITQGRREFIYALVLAFVYSRARVGVPALGRASYLTATLFLVVAYVGYTAFFAIRYAQYSIGSDSSLYDLMGEAISIVRGGSSFDFQGDLGRNTLERPFIIGYLATVLEHTQMHAWFWGDAAASSIKMAVPSVFLGSKDFLVDEELINPRIGLPVVDEANSILTAGIADFGAFGAITYPCIIVILYGAAIKLVGKFHEKSADVFLCVAALHALINVECGTTDYFSSLRDSMLVIGILVISGKLINRISTRKSKEVWR